MTKKVFFYLFLVGTSLVKSYGQTDANVPNLLMTVANLRNDSISGSGVFIQHTEADYYLVATAHIAETMDKNAFVVIQAEEQPLQFKITDFANPVTWVHHPAIDLAVLKLNPKPAFFNKHLLHRFIPLAWADNTRLPLSKDSLLTILGFRPGSSSSGFFPPLAYTSIPSSEKIILKDPDEKIPPNLIVLEKPSVTGYSGGPVFLTGENNQNGDGPTADNQPRMVGLMQGKIKDNAGRTFMIMIPATYLYDLIK